MIRDIARWSGIDPGAKLNLRDPDQAQRFLGAVIRREQGHPEQEDALRQGVQLGLGAPVAGLAGGGSPAGPLKVDVNVTHRNSPPGSSVSATAQGTGFVTSEPLVQRTDIGGPPLVQRSRRKGDGAVGALQLILSVTLLK